MNFFYISLNISLIWIFCTVEVLGQSNMIYHIQPFVRNFTKEEYKGANKNWSITQDEQGILYFGNTYGLLEFNGADWQLYTNGNISFIRSVYTDTDGKIYSGSFEEFGYWQRNSYGELYYTSLSQQLLDQEDISNSTIWKIFRIGKYLYFHSFSRIFVYDGSDINIIEKDHETFLPIFKYRGKPYVCILNSGLFSINEDFTLKVEPGPDFISELRIQHIFDINQDTSVIFTEFNGIYLKIGKTFVKPSNPGNLLMETCQINRVLRINDQLFAVGTIKHGLLITDCYGNIKFRIDKSNGLQHNTVLSLWIDPNGKLWVGLVKGIDYIEISAPFYFIKDKTGRLGSVTSSVLYKGSLYLGTNQGLLYADWDRLIHRGNTEFVAIPEFEGHVLSLDVIDGQLICGFNLGTYRIEDNQPVKLSDIGGHSILVHPDMNNIAYQGIYTGIAMYNKDISGIWRFSKVLKETEHIRYLQIDHEGNLWTSGAEKGLHMHQLNDSGDSIIHTINFSSKDGFVSDYFINVFKLGNRLVFTDRNSFYTYDYLNREIVPYTWLNRQIGSFRNSRIIKKTSPLEYWFISRSSLGKFNFLYDSLILRNEIKYDYLHASTCEYCENITKINERYYIIGLDEGFAILDYDVLNNINNDNFRQVRINSFNCFNKEGITQRIEINNASIPKICFRNRNLLVKYSVPGTTQEQFTFYYRFSDLEPWLELENTNSLQYNNLRSGSYNLEIKAVGETSGKNTTISFPFVILPPWYFHWIAIVSYVLIFIGFGLITRKIITIRIHNRKMEYLEKIRNESEKEMARMKQEYLQRELRNKSKELVNYTILLDKRNELLNRLKSMLSKELETPKTSPQNLRLNLINIIDRNLSSRNDWQIFKFHFDAANSDFLEKLKNLHQNLTPSDLRFCALLRMNLTSKEIASLLSISLRSIEVKRYRLRKKLNLEHDKNLVEYLLSV